MTPARCDTPAGTPQRVIELLRDHARSGAVVLMSTNDDEAAASVGTALALDEGRISA